MMEKLTQDMADKAWSIIEEIEAMGGMTKAVESGWAKMQVETCAADKQARIDSGKDVIVGVNKYKLAKEDAIDILDIDNHAVREAQVARLQQIRATRDSAAVEAALNALTECAKSGQGNLLDLAVKAVRLRATVGEVSDALEVVFGRHRADIQKVTGVYAAAYDSAEGWDKLKGEIAAFADATGLMPTSQAAADATQLYRPGAFGRAGLDRCRVAPLAGCWGAPTRRRRRRVVRRSDRRSDGRVVPEPRRGSVRTDAWACVRPSGSAAEDGRPCAIAHGERLRLRMARPTRARPAPRPRRSAHAARRADRVWGRVARPVPNGAVGDARRGPPIHRRRTETGAPRADPLHPVPPERRLDALGEPADVPAGGRFRLTDQVVDRSGG